MIGKSAGDFNRMINLFEKSKEEELHKLTKEIQSYFSGRCNSTIQPDKKLQQKINTWRNLSAYQYLKLDEEHSAAIIARINEWYNKYKNKLDSTVEKFTKDFTVQCFQNIFELVIADLISKKFTLKTKNSPPDLEFNQYFIECTTRTTSLLDEWDKLLPKFSDFFDVSSMLFNKFILLKRSYNLSSSWYFDTSIEFTWENLSHDQKEYITAKLSFLSTKSSTEIIKKICDWISINRYACLHFKNILSPELLDKLKQIEFPINSTSDEKTNFYFIAKCIALSICDKLKADYFQKGNPGIIAISLTSLVPGISFSDPATRTILDYLYTNLFEILRSAVQEKFDDTEKEKIFHGQHNLFAIILDTNWYNWFPDILENSGAAKFSGGCKNIYSVVYNTKFLTDNKHEPYLFDSIIMYRLELPLNTLFWLPERALS